MFTQSVLRVVILAAALGALAGQMQNVVLVLFLVQALNLSPGLIGLAITIAGVAGVLSAIVTMPLTRRVGPGPAFILGMVNSALAGVVLALAGGPRAIMFLVIALAQALRGAGPSLYGVNQQTLRQTLVPPEAPVEGERDVAFSRVRAAARGRAAGRTPRLGGPAADTA